MAEFYYDRRMHGITRPVLGDPGDADVWLPPDMKDCVAFLCVQDRGKWLFGGTAFFLYVPSSHDDGFYIYTVTAKHNVERAAKHWRIRGKRRNRG